VDKQQGVEKGREDGAILWPVSHRIEGSGGGALGCFNAEVGKRKREGDSARHVGKEEKKGVRSSAGLKAASALAQVAQGPR
jgi:hypothetical protein